MKIKIIKYDSDIIGHITEDSGNIYKIGLGIENKNKTNKELEELILLKYNELKYRDANPSPPSFQVLRQKEYPSTNEMIVALWEDLVEGRPDEKNKLQTKREAIKLKYPKN